MPNLDLFNFICSYRHIQIFFRKKVKVGGFATLRKKFMRRRRCSKSTDHGRVIRDAVSDWSPGELACLLDEYEALAALKDLAVQAELARPPAPTFKQDLSTLYDLKYSTDVDLVFRGVCFPVHRAILSARCSYFRDLLAGCPGYEDCCYQCMLFLATYSISIIPENYIFLFLKYNQMNNFKSQLYEIVISE